MSDLVLTNTFNAGDPVDHTKLNTNFNQIKTYLNDGTALTTVNYATNKSDMCLTFTREGSLASAATTFKTKLPAATAGFVLVYATAYATVNANTYTVQVDKKSGATTTTLITTANLTSTSSTNVEVYAPSAAALSGGDELHVILTATGAVTGPFTICLWIQTLHRVAE